MYFEQNFGPERKVRSVQYSLASHRLKQASKLKLGKYTFELTVNYVRKKIHLFGRITLINQTKAAEIIPFNLQLANESPSLTFSLLDATWIQTSNP